MKYAIVVAGAARALAAGPTYALRNAPDPSHPIAASSVGSAAAQLDALAVEWDHIGFSTPSKPDGHVTDGPGYNLMVSLICSASIDSSQGREQEALGKSAERGACSALHRRNEHDDVQSRLAWISSDGRMGRHSRVLL